MVKKSIKNTLSRGRYYFVMLILGSLPLIVAVKIAQLQIMPSEERGVEFLQTQGDARAIRTETIPGHRGLITDRNGEPLAVSTPVITLIANPKRVNENAQPDDLTKLAKALNISLVQLQSRLKRYRNKSFMYLARQLPSVEADRILDLQIPGVFGRQEYKRFYPAGEVTAQLVGFTDINDAGQEGMELAYNAVLAGEPGAKKVVKDLAGRVIKDISLVKPASHGSTLRLSIDLRVQYAAYRALKASVKKHAAKSGSVIVLDVQTGEVLAMANQPSFNPNDRSNLRVDSVRNRSVIDMMEPGSTVKPFTILAALESGKFKPDTVINTSPGYIKVAYKTFYDRRDLGRLSLTDILNKSSQVGTTKLALALNPNNTRELFERMGFGEGIGSGFPGETAGNLPAYRKWDPVTQATYTFGYGFSASPLQLARAYSILANDGLRREVRMTAIDQYQDESVRVINADLVKTVRQMLETAASDQGTGRLAVIDGYSVGGKTGTARKIKATGGYDENRHMSLFAGLSPINNPRLVTVVVIDEPNEDKYAGGVVAAPVFSEVTGSALRLMQVTPDAMSAERNIVSLPAMLAKRGGL